MLYDFIVRDEWTSMNIHANSFLVIVVWMHGSCIGMQLIFPLADYLFEVLEDTFSVRPFSKKEPFFAMIGETQQLITDEPVELEK